MELLVASAVGAMTAAGLYLVLRARTFPVIVGLAMLSYAVNVFLFATGRLAIDLPPVISEEASAYTDPLPQALVLTAIVISFGMTALIVVLALRAYLESNTDLIDTAAGESESGQPSDQGTPTPSRPKHVGSKTDAAKKTTAKKATSKKTAVKKAGPKKASAKKAGSKKAAAKQPASRKDEEPGR